MDAMQRVLRKNRAALVAARKKHGRSNKRNQLHALPAIPGVSLVRSKWNGLSPVKKIAVVGGGVGVAVLTAIALWKRKEIAVTVTSLTDKAKWVKAMFDAATAALPHLSVKTRAFLTAHSALETGYGTNSPARLANNFFNITTGSQWPTAAAKQGIPADVYVQPNGDISFQVSTCNQLGRPMTPQPKYGNKLGCAIDQNWRKYPSMKASIADYWDFLGTQNAGRYKPARDSLEMGDVVAFANLLADPGDGKKGYFDAKILPEYIAGVTGTLKSVCSYLGIC